MQVTAGMLAVQPGQLQPGPLGVVHGQNHLEQRMAGQRADRGQHLHQLLERDLLVLRPARSASRTRASSSRERRVAGQVGAQHQGVDEEPDQVIQRLIRPPGDRRPGRDVVPAPSRDNNTASAACSTMNTVAPSPGPARPAARAPGRHLHPARHAPVAGHRPAAAGRRAAPAPAGRPGQAVPPVGQLPGQQAVRVVLGAEQLPLPQRVVRVLDRQAPTAGPAPRSRAAYGRRRSRPAAPIDQPSLAMWCITSTSTCSAGAARSSQARHGSLGRQVERVPADRATAAATSSSATVDDLQPPGRLRPGQDLLVRLPVRHRRTPCAAPRAARPRPAAPRSSASAVQLPAQPHAPAARCRTRPGPPAGPGTTAAAGRTTAAPAPAAAAAGQRPPRRGRAASTARPARPTVGASNSARSGTSAPNTARTRLDQPHRQQRVPAQVEEIIIEPDRVQAQHVGEQPAQNSSAPVTGPRPAAPAAAVRRRQRPPVELPVRRSPAARRAPPPPRDHVLRQPPRRVLPHRRARSSRPTSPTGIAGRGPRSRPAAIPGLVLPDTTAAWATPGQAASTASTSPGSTRNPRIFTCSSARPRNSSCPPGRPPRPVPGPVHPLPAGTERARHEPLRRQPRPGPDSRGPAAPRPRTAPRPPPAAPAPATHRARTPGCWRPARPIGTGPAVRRWPAWPGGRRTPLPRSARTGCPAGAAGSARRSGPPLRRQRLPAAATACAAPEHPAAGSSRQTASMRRHAVHHRHPLPRRSPRPARRVPAPVRTGHHQRRARQQRPEELPDRHVETDTATAAAPGPRPPAGTGLHPRQPVRHTAVRRSPRPWAARSTPTCRSHRPDPPAAAPPGTRPVSHRRPGHGRRRPRVIQHDHRHRPPGTASADCRSASTTTGAGCRPA